MLHMHTQTLKLVSNHLKCANTQPIQSWHSNDVTNQHGLTFLATLYM